MLCWKIFGWLLGILVYQSRCVYTVKLNKNRNSSLPFERGNWRRDFLQVVLFICFSVYSLAREGGLWALHLYVFINNRTGGRDAMSLSSVPSWADTSRCLNCVIHPPVCFIAREGDSVELRDRESHFRSKERRLLLPCQCFSEHGGGSPGCRQRCPWRVLTLFVTKLATSWPKKVFIFIQELRFLYLLFFFLSFLNILQ